MCARSLLRKEAPMTSPLPPHDEHTVAVVVPISALRDAPPPVVRRRNGRPRRVESPGVVTISEQAYLDALSAAASAAEACDEVVVATRSNDSRAVILSALREAARESSALAWGRARGQRLGQDGLIVERLSARRTNSLFRLVDLTLALMAIDAASLEPDSADVHRVVDLLMDAVTKVIGEVADPEMADAFLHSLRSQMREADFPACCTRRVEGPDHQG